MEDADANNQDENRDIVRATVCCLTGNFKIDEDMKLASAYVFATTNAAVGTDQDGETYWKKFVTVLFSVEALQLALLSN